MSASSLYSKILRAALFIVVALIFSISNSCGNSHSYPREFQIADSLCGIKPDSALAYLKEKADSLSSISKEDKYVCSLLMIRASDKADLPIKNDSIILDVAEYLEKESSPYQTAAYYYVGRYYSDNGDAVKALMGFQQALSCSEKAGEKKYRLFIYSQMGYLFANQYMYDKAKKMRELHLKGSMEQKDTIGIINSLCDIADAYSLNDNYEKALPKIKRALALSRIYGNDRITVNMLSQTARYYNMANLPDSAFLYINEMLRNPSYVENKSKCSIIATAYKKAGIQDSAYFYFKKLYKYDDIYARQYSCEYMMEYYLQKKNLQLLKVAISDYLKYSDSVKVNTNSEVMARIDGIYNYQKMKSEVDTLLMEQKEKNIILYSSVVVSILCLCVLFFIILCIRQKKSKYELKFLMYKNKEQKKKADSKELLATPICSKILDIEGGEPVVSLTAGELSDLDKAFEEYMADFNNSLNSLCKISDHERHICQLLRLGISVRNIGELLCRDISSISKARSRMFKRAFNKKGEPSDFDLVIRNL